MAKLGREASYIAAKCSQRADFPGTLAKQRAVIKTTLQMQLQEIEALVSKLLD